MEEFTKEHIDMLNSMGKEGMIFLINKIKNSILKENAIECMTLMIIQMLKASILSNVHLFDMTVTQSLTKHFELLSAMLSEEGISFSKIKIDKVKN